MLDAAQLWDELSIKDGVLSPRSTFQKAEWVKAVRHVADRGKGVLFVLSRQPELIPVAIAPQLGSTFVIIRTQRPSLCEQHSVEEFARLIGLTDRVEQASVN